MIVGSLMQYDNRGGAKAKENVSIVWLAWSKPSMEGIKEFG